MPRSPHSQNITEGHCFTYAWVLMGNHIHLLFRSGTQGIYAVMRKLLAWYAQYYNRRHRHSGHLFENRYKLILCDEEAYLLVLVRSILLNPVGVRQRLPVTSGWPLRASQGHLRKWLRHGVKERCNVGNNAPNAYVVIRNTLKLDEMYVSETVWEEVKGRTNIRPTSDWENLSFDSQGNLTLRV